MSKSFFLLTCCCFLQLLHAQGISGSSIQLVNDKTSVAPVVSDDAQTESHVITLQVKLIGNEKNDRDIILMIESHALNTVAVTLQTDRIRIGKDEWKADGTDVIVTKKIVVDTKSVKKNIRNDESVYIKLEGFPGMYQLLITNNSLEPAKEAGNSFAGKIMLLNAANFDFSGALGSNYVGHLNLFAPSLKNKNQHLSHWGFNTGIMKIDYSNTDTSSDKTYLENVSLNPLDTSHAVGSNYLRQLNQYKTVTKNTTWSFYGQLLYRITHSLSCKNKIYLHFHTELLVNKWSVSNTVTTLKQDTGVITNPNTVVRAGISNSSVYVTNIVNGYFGGGLTFDLTPWDGASFFFQPTIGYTTNYAQQASVDLGSVDVPQSSQIKNIRRINNWNTFYLLRACYTQKLSENSTVMLGMDIRGLFPRYSPQYAAYVGLNLEIASFLKLLGIGN